MPAFGLGELARASSVSDEQSHVGPDVLVWAGERSSPVGGLEMRVRSPTAAELRSAGRVGTPAPTWACYFRPLVGCPVSIQDLRQELSGVRIRQLGDGLRRAGADHVSPALAALGAEINDPVCCLDDFQIVLDDQNRAPCFN